MPDSSHASREAIVANKNGLHLRPAALLAKQCTEFQSEIELVKDDLRVDASSPLSILTLGASQGTTLCVEATGPDAEATVTAIADLIENGVFGELPAQGDP